MSKQSSPEGIGRSVGQPNGTAAEARRIKPSVEPTKEGEEHRYPVHVSGPMRSVFCGVTVSISDSGFSKLSEIPQNYLDAYGRWQAVRHAGTIEGVNPSGLDVTADKKPTGFEGFFADILSEPKEFLEQLLNEVRPHIILAFNPNAHTTDRSKWPTTLGYAVTGIRSFIQKIETHQLLTQTEKLLGERLFTLILAKLRAREHMHMRDPKASKKLTDFRRSVAQRAQARQMKVDLSEEQDAVLLKVSKGFSGIHKEYGVSAAHLSEPDKLLLRLLQVLGKFGNPVYRTAADARR
jgi:hypothetical protein